MTDSIHFPCYYICSKYSTVVAQMVELSETTRYAYDNGCFDQGVLIDVLGNQFNLKELGAAKPIGLVPQWLFFLDPKVQVELNFTYTCNHNLDEFKDIFLKTIRRDSDFWESAFDITVLGKLVENADTIQDVLHLI